MLQQLRAIQSSTQRCAVSATTHWRSAVHSPTAGEECVCVRVDLGIDSYLSRLRVTPQDVYCTAAGLCCDAELQRVGDGCMQTLGSELSIGRVDSDCDGASIRQRMQQRVEASRRREPVHCVDALRQYPAGLACRVESLADGEERSSGGSISCRLRPSATGAAVVSLLRRRRRRWCSSSHIRRDRRRCSVGGRRGRRTRGHDPDRAIAGLRATVDVQQERRRGKGAMRVRRKQVRWSVVW